MIGSLETESQKLTEGVFTLTALWTWLIQSKETRAWVFFFFGTELDWVVAKPCSMSLRFPNEWRNWFCRSGSIGSFFSFLLAPYCHGGIIATKRLIFENHLSKYLGILRNQSATTSMTHLIYEIWSKFPRWQQFSIFKSKAVNGKKNLIYFMSWKYIVAMLM